jgi:hypothetical protein
MLNHNDTLAADRLIPGVIHDIRLENAVYHTETSRFGPDAREHLHVAKNGRILTNLFQKGTALVASQDGTVLASVSARNASRAAACVALRHIRSGGAPVSIWDVTTFKNGGSHSETIHHGFDHVAFRDDSFGDEKGMCEIELSVSEIALLDKMPYYETDVDGWQDSNWDGHLSRIGTGN